MARRRRRLGWFDWVTFALVLVAIGAVVVWVWPDSEDAPALPGCSAHVSGMDVDLDPEQGYNASLIAAIAIRRGLPARAVSIALAAAYQESKIYNLNYGDLDSVGLFQQRPSQGWGSRRQILNPAHAINAFYDALVRVHGYEGMRITVAAQKVQRSGYPEAYEAHAPAARALASALTGYSAGGAFSCVVLAPKRLGTAAAVERSLTSAYGDLPVTRTGVRQDVAVTVGSGTAGKRLGWSVAGYLLAHADELKIRAVTFDHRSWHTGRPSEKGWQPAPHTNANSASTLTISLG